MRNTGNRRAGRLSAARRLAVLTTAGLLAAAALAGCAAPARLRSSVRHPAPTPSRQRADPGTVAALLRIARVFNNDYDDGDFGAVWDRWDARSRALISRASYIRRHRLCAPATHQVAQVEDAVRAGGGAWHVRYQIDGQQLVDTWYYADRRWAFDILLSNPGAARLYRMPFSQYVAAVGCNTH